MDFSITLIKIIDQSILCLDELTIGFEVLDEDISLKPSQHINPELPTRVVQTIVPPSEMVRTPNSWVSVDLLRTAGVVVLATFAAGAAVYAVYTVWEYFPEINVFHGATRELNEIKVTATDIIHIQKRTQRVIDSSDEGVNDTILLNTIWGR